MKFGNIIKRPREKKNKKVERNQEMWLRFYKENTIGVSIIDSMQHCRTENALERDKNQEMRVVSI